VLRYSLGLRLLADDVQLRIYRPYNIISGPASVSERRQLGSTDVRNFTHASSERHRLPPATDRCSASRLRRQCIYPYRLKAYCHIYDTAQTATHTPFMNVRRVKITLAYFTFTVIGLLTCVPVCLLVYPSSTVHLLTFPPSLLFL